MLKISIEPRELFNSIDSTFIQIKGQEIQMEHSLVSLSKWEAKWKIPFLTAQDKTEEQTYDYFRCMTLTQNVDPITYLALTSANVKKIKEYIEDPMSATTFNDRRPNRSSREVITSELVYYWMIAYNIPFECQKWHLNRLLALIRICSIKNDTSKSKNMSRREILSQNKSLNEARKRAMHTNG